MMIADVSTSVVFQWTISYMVSPDYANLGVKAIYVWAGLLVPTTLLLWMYYPEVSICMLFHCSYVGANEMCRPKDEHIGSWTSCTNARFPLGSSRRLGL